jgi:hypothetical protein
MDVGVAVFPTQAAMAPGELARLVEQRGYESLFVASVADGASS